MTGARVGAAVLCLSVLTTLAPAAGAQSVKGASGQAMCAALAPADFTRQGVPVSRLSQANLDGPEGAYCVYESRAGKVEFDVFFPAGRNPREVRSTFDNVLGENGRKAQKVALAGADEAFVDLAPPDLQNAVLIVVRKGTAVFDIVIPKGPSAQQQLTALAQIVLARLTM